MAEKLFQIKYKGVPFCDPVGVRMKNALLHGLIGVLNEVDVECEEVTEEEKPQLRLVEGGRK